ncbi:hypothetical protein [Pseudovibrio ascidiaceicola]|uniref:hypothetical protein n=1 Tax=Pseudovibrio ascidiaceicola TaxID=285279 RepID=UPI000D698CFA|nr:hypothetical protein [Pseudovibrio ascidiaceicola]
MLTQLLDRAIHLKPFGLTRIFPKVEGRSFSEHRDKYDTTTLFYDVFRSHDCQHIILIGPKPIGYEKELSAAKFFLEGKKLKAKQRKLKRVHEIWIKVPANKEIASLVMEINNIQVELKVAQETSSRFKGKRVLSTLCVDTPIPWILDWIKFHAVNHGANAVVLFENSIGLDHAQNIHRAIEDADLGIEYEIVHAPFKYGPPYPHEIKFLQRSILQLVRWKYVQTSEALLFCDIDELIICDDGQSIFDHVQKSFLGYYMLRGTWIEPATQLAPEKLASIENRRHFMFQHTSNPPSKTNPKWVAVPSRIPRGMQFKAHGIRPEPKHQALFHPFFSRLRPFLKAGRMCHFWSINTSWAKDRQNIEAVDPKKHVLHKDLNAACMAAFSSPRETD